MGSTARLSTSWRCILAALLVAALMCAALSFPATGRRAVFYTATAMVAALSFLSAPFSPIVLSAAAIVGVSLLLWRRVGRARDLVFSLIVLSILCVIGFFGHALTKSIGLAEPAGELRLAPGATASLIARKYIDEPANAFIGTGAHSFTYAWNMYRPLSANTTPVWNVEGISSFGLLPQIAATLGAPFAFFLFLLLCLFVGAVGKSLAKHSGIAPLGIAAAFLLIWLIFYLPSSAYLALTALFAGLVLGTISSAREGKERSSRMFITPPLIVAVCDERCYNESMSVTSFIKYNNAVPLLFGALFLLVGGAFAASEDARDAVYSSEEVVRSIDNTYIVQKDLSTWTPTVVITGVTEDEENYYVAYDLATIDVADYVWRDVTKPQTLKVSKSVLQGFDLGLYVTTQLREVFDRQIAYLREVQKIERENGESHKVVATVYSGLVGKLLDPTEEVLPGYQLVVQAVSEAPASEASAQTASAGSAGSAGSSPQPSFSSGGASSDDRTPPTIQIVGNNPARIPVGSRYVDLGAVVTDNRDQIVSYKVTLNGEPISEIYINTQEEGTHTVRYTAEDSAGNSASVERTVEVYFDPALPRPQTGTLAPSAETTSEPQSSRASAE